MPRIRTPCSVCEKRVTRSHAALLCDSCDKWCHLKCQTSVSNSAYEELLNADEFNWDCPSCAPGSPVLQHHPRKRHRASLELTFMPDLHSSRYSTELDFSINMSVNEADPPVAGALVPLLQPMISQTTPQQQSEPEPGHQPEPEPGHQPELEPGHQPESEPLPVTLGRPVPAPRGQPVPAPRGQPVPAPRGQPVPAPRRQPVPAPLGQPVPAPRVQPVPAPRRQPDPVTPPLRLVPRRRMDDPDVPNLSDQADPDLPAYNIPDYPQENSLLENELPQEVAEQGPAEVIYEVVEGATKRGRSHLIDSLGFTYSRTKITENGAHWRCTVRTRVVSCKATVNQAGSTYRRGPSEHCHEAAPNALTKAKLVSKVNSAAKGNVFESAGTIVRDALADAYNRDQADIPKKDNLIRNANRQRAGQRPKDPSTLDFAVEEDHLPNDFFKQDIRVNASRHLLFMTTFMATLLAAAKTWYVDATFKVVARPFYQLFSIHCFVKKGSAAKQVPLVFILMSSRRKDDYVAVFEAVLHHLPQAPAVMQMVMDFEPAMWSAAKTVFTRPNFKTIGCHFHWNQAIWRKIQNLGLSTLYKENESVRKFCRKVMALPFLPAEHITPMFNSFEDTTRNADGRFKELLDYVNSTWIVSALWPPSTWSVFMRPIRTNNDVEGWHRALNYRAHSNSLGLYRLLQLLNKECLFLTLEISLVGQEALTRYQRLKYQRLQCDIFSIWEKYNNDEIKAKDLIKMVTYFNGPASTD